MPIRDPELWDRLQAWHDGEGGQRLRRMLGVRLDIYPRNRTLVMREVLRFAYLAAHERGAVPPPLLTRVLAELPRDAAAFAALEAAAGVPLPTARMHDSDPRHRGLHAAYRATFDEEPPPSVWYGAEEYRRLSRAKAGFVAFAAALGLGALGTVLENVVLGMLAVPMMIAGVAVILVQLRHGPIRVDEAGGG